MTKAELRRELQAARRARPTADRRRLDVALLATLADLLATRGATTVAAYVPMDGEPGGTGLPEALATVAARVILPVVLPDRDLDWAEFQGPESLVPARLGLREPSGPRLGPDAIGGTDVIIVPALGVDREGVRLGRGGGSYDRALARTRPPRLVLALLYPGELRDRLPSDPHDQPVDGVVLGDRVTLLSP